MQLLCDEDVGAGVPRALYNVGYSARALVDLKWGGKPDVKWLAMAGQNNWLVFSCNKRMLLVQDEKQAIIDHKVGIVFLTNGEEHSPRVLKLLLNRWHWLESIDKPEDKPFAYFLSLNGRISQTFTYRGIKLRL